MDIKQLKPCALAIVAAAVAILAGCSSTKNTARSRWWQAFNARYNTYFNGSQAYIEGSLEKENGNQDNYTELIPLYTVGNKASRELGKANFDRAILKAEKAIQLHSIKRRPEWNKNRRKTARDIEWLNRREYNPFLWKAWMLMGRAQFHEGDFDAAASTFAYMSRLYETQPAIRARAQAWLVKCYIESGYRYDAEDVIRNMSRDSIPWQARKEWDYALADYHIHTGSYAEAIPYLRKVISHEMRRKQKAREWFLMGQLCQALGRQREAYQAYSRTIRMSPPYELEFNARIAQTEVLAGQQSRKMLRRLRLMAASDKNKDYLDQVYYAMGNIYLSQRDTAKAITAYERGNSKATRSGIERGVLLLKLGDLYWQLEKFADAQRCYGQAIGLLDKERPDYEQLSARSKVLDELVPYTEAVHLQDSLQELARMDEPQRNAAIDRVIEALKKKEKEEQRAKDEQAAAEAQQRGNQTNRGGRTNQTAQTNRANGNNQSATWYFYNPVAVTQGKQQFERTWGKRENADNWQRNNKTVVAMQGEGDEMAELTDEQRDSIFAAQQHEDSLQQIADSAQNDPHKREYYLAQIPFTAEQVEQSNATIMDGLYNSGVIFKDKLDNLPLSEKALRRLLTQYPTYAQMDNVYYHLFLLYSRMGQPQTADAYVDSLKAKYPSSQWTTLLTDPNYALNARYGVHLEDSLYAATYEAFKADRNAEVAANVHISAQRFPLGANRDKFIFIGALGKLNSGDSNGCMSDLDTLVAKYPTSELSTMAGMIINGVKAGRRLRGARFDIGDVWARRTEVLSDSAEMKQRQLSNERNTPFDYMLVYAPDSVDENKLLYQVARYNFTSFLVRDFGIAIDDEGDLHRLRISGFRNYDEALQYARQIADQKSLVAIAAKARPIVISTENLPLIGTVFSYDDYDKFYNAHFAPLKVSTFRLLTEPAEVTTVEPQRMEESQDQQDGSGISVDSGAGTPVRNETVVPVDNGTVVTQEGGLSVPVQNDTVVATQNRTVVPVQKATVVPADTLRQPTETDIDNFLNDTFIGNGRATRQNVQPVQIGGVDIDLGDEEADTTGKAKADTVAPVNRVKPTATTPVAKTKTATVVPAKKGTQTPATPVKKTKPAATQQPKKKETQQTPTFDLDDEYYDLDGF